MHGSQANNFIRTNACTEGHGTRIQGRRQSSSKCKTSFVNATNRAFFRVQTKIEEGRNRNYVILQKVKTLF